MSSKTDIGLREIYKDYGKSVEDPVEYKMFRDVWTDFIKDVTHNIIYNNFHFRMPDKLGFLMIIKKKVPINLNEDGELITKHLTPDWKRTKELWEKIYPGKTPEELKQISNKKIVYHTNRHTDGFRMSWYWDKRALKNNTAYSFKVTRTNSRAVKEAIDDPTANVNYHEY